MENLSAICGNFVSNWEKYELTHSCNGKLFKMMTTMTTTIKAMMVTMLILGRMMMMMMGVVVPALRR